MTSGAGTNATTIMMQLYIILQSNFEQGLFWFYVCQFYRFNARLNKFKSDRIHFFRLILTPAKAKQTADAEIHWKNQGKLSSSLIAIVTGSSFSLLNAFCQEQINVS